MKNIADIITGSRIVFSIAILFIHPFSPMFYVLYGMAGFNAYTYFSIFHDFSQKNLAWLGYALVYNYYYSSPLYKKIVPIF